MSLLKQASKTTNKNMFIRHTVFVAIFSIIISILYYIGSQFYSTYWFPQTKVMHFLKNRDKAEVVLLGSSHALCVSFDELGIKEGTGYSISALGSDMFEIAYHVRTAVLPTPNLKTVLVSMSYFSFLYDHGAFRKNGKNDMAGKRREMYASYPAWGFLPGDLAYYIEGKLYPVITEDHWEKVFTQENLLTNLITGVDTLLGKVKRVAGRKLKEYSTGSSTLAQSIPKDLLQPRETKEAENKNGMEKDKVVKKAASSKKIRTKEWLTEDARVNCKIILENIKNVSKNHPGLYNDSYACTVSWIKKLKKRNVRIVFFTPPYWKKYNDMFYGESRAVMIQTMRRLVSQYGVEYYNFSTDEEFVNDPTLFKDSNHLNKDGSTKFCAKLKAAMDKAARKSQKKKELM